MYLKKLFSNDNDNTNVNFVYKLYENKRNYISVHTLSTCKTETNFAIFKAVSSKSILVFEKKYWSYSFQLLFENIIFFFR